MPTPQLSISYPLTLPPVIVWWTCGLPGGSVGRGGRGTIDTSLDTAHALSALRHGGIQGPWSGWCYASYPGQIRSGIDDNMYPVCSPYGICLLFPRKTCSRYFHPAPMVCGTGGNGPKFPPGLPPKWRPQFTCRRGAPLVWPGQRWNIQPLSVRTNGGSGWWKLRRDLSLRRRRGRGNTPQRTVAVPPTPDES